MANHLKQSISPQGSFIMPIQTQSFNFHLPSSIQEQNNIALLQFRNSMTIKVKPTHLNMQINSKQKQQFTSYSSTQGWKPKIPSKKLFDEPRFLLSLQRKKVRMINGLKDSELQKPEIDRKLFKTKEGRAAINHKISEYHRGVREQNEIKDDQQNFIEEGQISRYQNRKKAPNMKFNLHHLIRQRRSFIDRKQSKYLNKKQGSNIPYLQFFTSQKFHIRNRRNVSTSGATRNISVNFEKPNHTSFTSRTSKETNIRKYNDNQ